MIAWAAFVVFSLSFSIFLHDDIFKEITGRQIFLDNAFEQKPGAFKPSNPSNVISLSPSENGCELESISLSHSVAKVGDTVSIYIEAFDGKNCGDESLEIKIFEKDIIFDDFVKTLSGKFLRNKVTIDLVLDENLSSLFDEFLEGNDIELYFSVRHGNKELVFDSLSISQAEDILLQPSTPLSDNQAYIKNPTSQTVTNHLASFPIGFSQGQYNNSTIQNLRLQGLKTQVYPTTYYSDGSIRTAIVYSLVTLNSGQEIIYNLIDSTSVQTYNRHPSVQNFFNQGEITAISRDLNGNAYNVTIPLSSLVPIVDGPVIKKYLYTKTHSKPVGSSNPLNYLFTSVFVIEEVSDQPYLKIQHLITNSMNLDEDVQNGFNYAEGQLGDIRYRNIELYISSNNPSNPSNVSVSLLDGNGLKPTYVAPKPDSMSNRIWIMPSDGEQTLYNNYNFWGQHLNLSYNYIGAGQGFLTELVLWLDTSNNAPKSYDPIYESPLLAGTSLARFNLIPDGPFPDVPNPLLLGEGTSRLDFNYLLSNEIGNYDSQVNGYSYRFGYAGIGKFDIGSAGESGVNHKGHRAVIYYLMSCNNRCDQRFLKTLRLFKYGAMYTGDVIPGFVPAEHLESQLFGYRVSLFGTFNGQARCSTQDWLGFCNVKVGNSLPGTSGFITGPGEGHRLWTHFEDSHSSVGTGMNYYMLTGDIMSHYITEAVYSHNIAFLNYGYTHGTGGYQARSFGRLGHSTVDLYQAETDPVERAYYVTTADRIASMVEDRRDQSAPGSRGNNPITGDPYPVGFVDSFTAGSGYSCTNMQGQVLDNCEQRSFTWQDSKIIEGLTEMYRSIPLSNPAFVRTLVQNMLDTQFTYGFKNYDQIRSGSPGLIPGTFISEGTGYLSGGLVVGPPPGGYCLPPNCNSAQVPYSQALTTVYGNAFVDYNFPAYCLALKYVVDPLNPKKPDWDSKLDKAFTAYINVVSNNDASQFSNSRGFSVLDGHFHDYICAAHYVLGVPNARESATSLQIDNDGDGFSEATGDCNDASININPAVGETWEQSPGVYGCADNIDANCNGLVDCDDPQCTINYWPPNNEYCRSPAKFHLGDGLVQNPNFEGRQEQCDMVLYYSNGTPLTNNGNSNSCLEGKCIASYTYAEGLNGFCALGLGLSLTSINPAAVYSNTPTVLSFNGFNFDSPGAVLQSCAELGVPASCSDLPSGSYTVISSNLIQRTVNLVAGTYEFRVRNVDNEFSNVRSITVIDNVIPSATLNSPQNAALLVTPTSVPFSANIIDNEAVTSRLLIKRGSSPQLSDQVYMTSSTAPYTFNYNWQPSPVAPDSSTKLFVNFDQETNLVDVTGLNSAPTIRGASYTPSGKYNGAYDFEGDFNNLEDISFASSSHLALNGRKISVEFWIYMDSPTQTVSFCSVPVIAKCAGGGCWLSGYDFNLVADSSTCTGNQKQTVTDNSWGVFFFLRDGVAPTFTGTAILSDNVIVPGTWNHVVGTYDADAPNPQIKLYINGVLTGSTNYNKNLVANSDPLYIGSGGGANVGRLNGKMDNVAIYDKTLTSQEVLDKFNFVPSFEEGTYYWRIVTSDAGNSVNSEERTFTISNGVPTIPNAPGNLVSSTLSSSSISLTWQDNSGNEDNFILQRRGYPGGVPNQWINITLPANSVSYTDSGLVANRTYEYRIFAKNIAGESAFSTASFSTTFICDNGQMRACPNQNGVCAGAQETCTSGNWPACTASTYESNNAAYNANEIGLCSDGLDNDCDVSGEFDYAGAGLVKGDNDCPVSVTGINAPSSAGIGSPFTLTCTSNPGNVRSVQGLVNGNICSFVNWQGNNALFNCVSSTVGTQQVNCNVNTAYSYQTGNNLNQQITIGGSCSSYGSSSSCEADNACDWCIGCSGTQSSGAGNRCVSAGSCGASAYQCIINQCGATCDGTVNGCSQSQTCNTASCGCTEQNPILSNVISSVGSWSSSGLVTINGQYFANNAQVFVNGVQILDSRLTRAASTITFNRNAQEFNVGQNSFVVRNPSSNLNSTIVNLSLTSNPTIISIVPNVVTNNVLTIVNITGNDFDPNSKVMLFGVVEVPSFLVLYVNSSLIQLSAIPGLEGTDLEVSVLNGAGNVLSNALNVRVNYPFDYVLSSSVSEASLISGDSLSGTLKVETLLFMEHETLSFVINDSDGLNIILLDNLCDINISTTPYPSCEIGFIVSTNGASPGNYVLVFGSNSSDTFVSHEVNITVTINAQSGTTTSGSSSGSGSGSGSSGGSSGGVRPPVVTYQCDDNFDNDGDGDIDYPNDLGCSSLNDNSELDPSEIVESNYTIGTENPQNLNGSGEEVEIRVVFWMVLLALIGGIVTVLIILSRYLLMKRNFASLASTPNFGN